MTSTPSPQQGIWTLTAPDGRTWQADSPLKAVSAEQRERVPAKVAVDRIFAACEEAQPAVLAVPGWDYDTLYWLIRGTGYVTRGQADEIVQALLAAAPAIHEGGERG